MIQYVLPEKPRKAVFYTGKNVDEVKELLDKVLLVPYTIKVWGSGTCEVITIEDEPARAEFCPNQWVVHEPEFGLDAIDGEYFNKHWKVVDDAEAL